MCDGVIILPGYSVNTTVPIHVTIYPIRTDLHTLNELDDGQIELSVEEENDGEDIVVDIEATEEGARTIIAPPLVNVRAIFAAIAEDRAPTKLLAAPWHSEFLSANGKSLKSARIEVLRGSRGSLS